MGRNTQKANKIRKLNAKIYKYRRLYDKAILDMEQELHKITNLHVSSNYFVDDGFCVSVGNEDRNDYISIGTAISQIEETGTIDPKTNTYY